MSAVTISHPNPAAVRARGEVFTRRWVVETLLDLTLYTCDRDLGALTLVEPSAGSGAFLGPVVERLLSSAHAHGRDPDTLGDAIRAWELHDQNVEECRSLVRMLLLDHGVSPPRAEGLARRWVVHGDFLLADGDLITQATGPVSADVVVGNPPYVRLEDLPGPISSAYRRSWPTMGGRADVYVGFIERSLGLLRPGGRVGFICADRWMRNQYGEGLRRLVSGKYAVDAVWSMHDVNAFETQVSAYPAITVLRNGPQGSVVVADTNQSFMSRSARALVGWTDERSRSFEDVGVMAHRLPHWFNGGDSWPAGTPARLRLIEYLNTNFRPIHDLTTETRVGIGVATGADKVLITTDSALVEYDRLLPLAMVRDLADGIFRWSGHYLVNPWGDDGHLVSLADFPRLRAYLHSAGSALCTRYVARRSPQEWYRTIDKVQHGLIDRPKLLLQDMRAAIHPVLDPGGHYPHHNLYYVESETWDMEVLGGILLSQIAQAFIEAYSVRMRGGTLRFQSQYLRRICVPDPDTITPEIASALRTAFRLRDRDGATRAAGAAYGIDLKEYDIEPRDR
jgi:adenine-specific DNA-methyltransferase